MRRRALFALILVFLFVIVPVYMSRNQPPSFQNRVVEARSTVRLYQTATGRIVSIPLESYLIGVVAAEMPADFPMEALKAQAVAARTLIMQRLIARPINALHPGADIDDDPRHGQAWIDTAAMKKRWGSLGYYENYLRVAHAVNSTRGIVAVYKGELIDPVFFASCGGYGTENSEDVWRVGLPYLRGVSCNYDHDVKKETATATLSLKQVDKSLGVDLEAMPVSSGSRTSPLQVITRTATGRPKLLRLGDKTMTAVEVRDLLGLRSTRFTWRIHGDSITFTTIGYGHGVGMCQYGARGMAEKGYNFVQILTHYYTGIQLERADIKEAP